tara:strand:- start:346 stop:1737 length:1392 start_codon:yes stop_codon:yes gene_type:complete
MAYTRGYKEKAANKGLANLVKNKSDLVNAPVSQQDILNTVSNAPQKFGKDNESRRAFIGRNTKNGEMNEAAKAMFNFYNDGRNKYQLDMNEFRNASPENKQAYAERFPVENFAMEGLPNIMPVIGPLNRVSNFLRNQKQNVAGKFGELFKKNNNNKGIASIEQGMSSPGMRAIAGEVRPSFSSNYNNEGYRDPTMNMAVPNSDAFINTSLLDDTVYNSSNDSSNDFLDDTVYDSPYDFTSGSGSGAISEADEKIKFIKEVLGGDGRFNSEFPDPQFVEYLLKKAKEKQALNIKENYNPGVQLDLDPNFDPNKQDFVNRAEYDAWKYQEFLREQNNVLKGVPEAQYVDPNDIVNQGNITTGFSETPLNQSEDQTDIFNAGSFPEMNIFGKTVGGPRHHLLNQINKYGNASSASEKEAFDILNSLGQADGGYISGFPNQNRETQSLTADDNYERLKRTNEYMGDF